MGCPLMLKGGHHHYGFLHVQEDSIVQSRGNLSANESAAQGSSETLSLSQEGTSQHKHIDTNTVHFILLLKAEALYIGDVDGIE